MNLMPRRVALGVLLVSVLFPSRASGQMEVDALRAEADFHTTEGLRLLDAGKPEDALPRLLLAHRIYPEALTRCNLGRAYRQLKQPAESVKWLKECAADRENLTPEQYLRVKTRIEEQQEFVGILVVTRNPKDATLKIDDIDVDAASAEKPILVVRGKHKITAEATNFFSMSRDVEIPGGLVETRVELKLKPIQSGPLPPPPPTTTEDGRRSYGSGAILVGSVLMAAGTTGIVVLGSKCLQNCKYNPDDNSDFVYETRNQVLFGTSLTGFMLGAAAVVTGIVWQARPEAKGGARQAQRSRVVPGMTIGGGYWGVYIGGSF